MPLKNREHQTTNARLLARLLRELLADARFESLPDVIEALKVRCARLRVHWTNDDLGDALRWVGSNTTLTDRERAVLRHVPREPLPTPAVFSRDEAARTLAALLARAQVSPAAVKTMPPAPWRDPDRDDEAYEAARERALEMGIELTWEAWRR